MLSGDITRTRVRTSSNPAGARWVP
jgi:hypothetical protein